MPARIPQNLSRLMLLGAVCLLTACAPRSESSLRKADEYFAAGAYDKAEIEYLNTVKADAGNVRAIARLGLIYADQGRTVEAYRLLSRARELQPDNLEVRVKLAYFYIASRDLARARDDLRYVLERNPADQEAPQLMAECAIQPAEISETRDYLRKLTSAGQAQVLLALALLELRQQNVSQAEAMLQQARNLDPNLPAVPVALGMIAQSQKRPEAAEAFFATAWKIAGPRAPQKMAYPRYKLQTGDLAGARRLLEELIKQVPDCIPPVMLLAEIAGREKKTDEALALVEKILARDQLNFSTHQFHARLLLLNNQPDKALATLEKLQKYQQKNPDLYYYQALAYVAKQDQTKAVASLRQAVDLAPDHADAVTMLAESSIRKGEPQAAILSLEALLTKKPDLLPARMLLGRAYASRGDTAKALATYRAVAAAVPKDGNLLLPIVQILRFEKKPAEARQVLLQALELNPDSIPVIENLIDLDLSEGRQIEARQRAEGLLQKRADQPAASLLMAKVELVAKNHSAVERHLLRAIELQPNLSLAYHLLAGLYSETQQEAKAIERLEDLSRREPKNVSVPMRIGLLSEQLKNYPAARAAYEKVLTLDPRFVPALNNLAYLLAERLNELDAALPHAQKVRELAPLDPNVADTLGWIYFRKGQYTSARNLLLESAAKVPDDAITQHHLGLAHYMMGEFSAARTALQRALQLKPTHPEAPVIKRQLAVLAIADTGVSPAARASLEKSIAEDKTDPVALTLLASLHEQGGELDQADKLTQAVLDLNPHFAPAILVRIRVMLGRQQVAAALELAKTTRKQYLDDPYVGHQLGRIALQAGDHVWAAGLLQDSARKLPDSPAVLADHARAAYCVGRVSETEDVFHRLRKEFPAHYATTEGSLYLEMISLARAPGPDAEAAILRCLQTKPEFVPALVAQGAWAEQNQNPAAARKAYAKILDAYPNFLPAKRSLTLLAASAPDADPKAYERAIQARDSFPGDAEMARAAGILACRHGDYGRAISLLKESQIKLGEQPVGLYYLGIAQAHTKDGAAKTTLQKALNLGLDEPLAGEARRLLAELK